MKYYFFVVYCFRGFAMEKSINDALMKVKKNLEEAQIYGHACSVLNFDLETICPKEGMNEQGDVIAYLSNKAFALTKEEEFIKAFEYLYENLSSLEDPLDKVLVTTLHRDYLKNKNISVEKDLEYSKIFNEAFTNWLEAKEKSDFSIFLPYLEKIRDIQLEEIGLREEKLPNPYDNLLDDYEKGMNQESLDKAFEECKGRLLPLLKKIMASKKKIRTDFLSREVSDEQQRQLANYLLETIGFDFSRGAMSLAEHPFTDGLGKNDARVTTHYYPNSFISSLYSIVHEGGHALFEQNQPMEDHLHFIASNKSMGMHESVSRFYENRIGRSKEFIHLIYPECKKIMPNVFYDVSEEEFYEAVNVVEPSLIRTEADEFTYTFHIIIRYEIERMILNKEIELKDLPAIWKKKYEEYLGVRPNNDKEGVLQDVHWSGGFGYFPTYSLGNFYNAMYLNKMNKDFDLFKAVKEGRFDLINDWMKNHVFLKANRLDSKEWIKDITGRDFTVEDFLSYLEDKYSKLYEL